MDPQAPVGAAVRLCRSCRRGFAACLVAAAVSPAFADDRYALIVSGASGGAEYARKYDAWRTSFEKTLREKFAYPDDHVIVLAEEEQGAVKRATRENVRAALNQLRRRATNDDVVLVLLVGHGTADGDDAKFNLVGPDLSAGEWAGLVRPIAGRLVFVNATGGSFPFLHQMAGRGRIVLTATDSAAQQFETLFPEFFVKAFDDPGADLDKDGMVSIWEAFSYASRGVKNRFEERGQLATERPMLDDTGDGVGREADTPGADGAVAQATYLQPDAPVMVAGDPELTGLLRRRAALEAQVERLKETKPQLTPGEYDAQLESLLLELARIDRQIRAKS